jgi:hypothetical protein
MLEHSTLQEILQLNNLRVRKAGLPPLVGFVYYFPWLANGQIKIYPVLYTLLPQTFLAEFPSSNSRHVAKHSSPFSQHY